MKCYMTGKTCDFYKRDVKNDKMFIISPFGFPYDSIYASDGIIQTILKNKLKIDPHRSDQTMRLGSIMCQGICKEIIERQYLMVDVSEPNPNVYYELGLSYALDRDIVVLLNKGADNRYVEILRAGWEKKKSAFIEYSSVGQLEKHIHALDLGSAITMGKRDVRRKVGKRVVILENSQGKVSGLFQKVLKGSQQEFKFEDDHFKGLTPQERKTFHENDWKQWKMETVRVHDKIKLSEIVEKIVSSKVCIIDTTSYKHILSPEINPYMYFFLGLSHGLEKEVIPLTNARHTDVHPFDVKGLWHIFFSDENSLKSGLLKIMPKISVDFHKEQIGEPYNKIWDGFLLNKERLSIIYCGRPNTPQERKTRGRRTNVDSWDSKTVSEASFYLAQKYSTTEIRPVPPRAKAQLPADAELVDNFKITLQREIERDLKKKYSNCMIVGSPDVSDYAEVVLAKIYNIPPFDNQGEIDDDSKRFVFFKHNLTDVVHSSFYRRVDKKGDGAVYFFKDKKSVRDKYTYGVLTIAQNPFNAEGKVIVLSGYSGIATFGLLRLLIDVHAEHPDETPGEKFRDKLKERLVEKYNPESSNPFSAIVRFEIEKTDTNHQGSIMVDMTDNRRIADMWVEVWDEGEDGSGKANILPIATGGEDDTG